MYLIYIWSIFIFFMGIAEIRLVDYLLFCIAMFYVTYICNQIKPIKLNVKFFFILILIPSSIFWWIIYVYNYLLSDVPIKEHTILSIIFLYFYIVIFIIWKSSFKKIGEYNSVG